MPVVITRKIEDPFGTSKRSEAGRSVARSNDWVVGWWENIGPTPVYIKSKEHLKQVCLSYGKKTGRTIIPKAFMKASSQGNSITWSF